MKDGSPSLRALVDRYDPEVADLTQGGSLRIRVVCGPDSWDVVADRRQARLQAPRGAPDATLTADAASWRRIAKDVRGGLDAFRTGGLTIRRNLHAGIGFLAATSGVTGPERLVFRRTRTSMGTLSHLEAGSGPPVLLLHGLGATKASLLPTLGALAPDFRVIAVDLPGFGDSDKPLAAPYDAPYFAQAMVALLDALDIDRADLVGNSMGGRVALELGLQAPDRARRLVLLCPSLAWLRSRPWAPWLRLVRPELGLLQPAPRRVVEAAVRRIVPGARDGWVAAGVDEFLRAYLTARGRAAFYAAARNIYLERPAGRDGFWTRLPELQPPALFVWGRQDTLVPLAFARHVRANLPGAEHLELDCGHVPQLEMPDEVHRAIRAFLRRSATRRARRDLSAASSRRRSDAAA